MIVTRFPPSPTGFLHIGNARTALFNWCFARANNGQFLLRVEDTDRERSTDEAVQAIFDALAWMQLDHDGDITYQSTRAERHSQVAHQLLEQGKAYWCHATPQELDIMREEAKQEGRAVAYDRRWRDKTIDDAPQDSRPTLRIKAPLTGETVIEDQVQGRVAVNNEQIDDFILLRSDGTPTYMLAVVVDDHDMGVTHVIRGDDHLNNAFRQKVIIDALGWDVPVYAHCPLIHGEDGGKFSKRHGALGVMDYAEQGYLREAVLNYLMRLGWSHGDDEIFSMDQAIEWFTLEAINKAPARFDMNKLNSLNQHYMRQADPHALFDQLGLSVSDQHKQWILQAMPELVERSTTLHDVSEEAGIFYDPVIQQDAKPLIEDNQETLKTLLEAFQNAPTFDTEIIKSICKNVAKDLHDGKMGKVGMPLRAALTGRKSSPGIFEVAAILGREETCARLENTVGN